MSNAVVLFGSKIPIHEAKGNYSLAWAGHELGESFIELLQSFYDNQTIPEVK